ncbi:MULTISPECIES: threonine ammonia-lyase IlvA [unclassified Paenibacillus]|uniref:threonine ammonia-lyase IlvA n=1 Tax=Paenibacillus TaxID=44249 RepID=UPI00020D6F6A|nr:MULTISPECIES: threonine ammonia-lyase IlvA [unclassified Paenibacillus]EGL15811.1 threonine ammonia-lyase [Paenibacillus sp. HGF7]EPD88188.1 threonine dehydratase [Paenibacillus sp. HGH0039]MBV6715622.1 threonine ammonia-lyase IlvA [Paenibacillus chitinolyticus]
MSNPSTVTVEEIIRANHALSRVIEPSPLQRSELLSRQYDCNIYLKREDLQVVRSFKIRGAYNVIQSLTEEERSRGVVCASAGNHAQGVAYSCNHLGIEGKIFMPTTTPRQKISQVKMFGGPYVEVVLIGDTFDDSSTQARIYCERENKVFIHPFDDARTIAGQGTVGLEVLNQMPVSPDFIFTSIGGGGLAAGVGAYVKAVSPETAVIGVEPEGAAGMQRSMEEGRVVTLETVDKFVDGAAVKQVGEMTFEICRHVLDDIVLVPEGKECTTILDLYNNNAIVIEPAGALPVAALDAYRSQIAGKNVVCVISGGNNDIDRMQEIKERSLIYEGLKHYFLVNFPQRAGALREFLEEVLGPTDDITRFEYMKKTNRDNAPALVGIELKNKDDYEGLISRLSKKDINYVEINNDPTLFNLLI